MCPYGSYEVYPSLSVYGTYIDYGLLWPFCIAWRAGYGDYGRHWCMLWWPNRWHPFYVAVPSIETILCTIGRSIFSDVLPLFTQISKSMEGGQQGLSEVAKPMEKPDDSDNSDVPRLKNRTATKHPGTDKKNLSIKNWLRQKYTQDEIVTTIQQFQGKKAVPMIRRAPLCGRIYANRLN